MKTILATILGISLMTGLAGQSIAASAPAAHRYAATLNGPPSDYDSPSFGSKGWWDEQGNQGG